MTVAYRFDCDNVTTAELEDLFLATGLGGRTGDKIRRAFRNSSLVCLVYDGDRLVGACRALSDGEYHALIYDVAVRPEYQSQGIGRQLMEQMLERLAVWRVMLVADGGVQAFYRKFGFERYADVMAKIEWQRLVDEPANHG